MPRSIHHQLIKSVRALSSVEAKRVRDNLEWLKSTSGVGPSEAWPGDDPARQADAVAGSVDDAEDLRSCADEADDGRDALGCDGSCSARAVPACGQPIWGKRPLEDLASGEIEPIAMLLRQAVDERDAKRHRFG